MMCVTQMESSHLGKTVHVSSRFILSHDAYQLRKGDLYFVSADHLMRE